MAPITIIVQNISGNIISKNKVGGKICPLKLTVKIFLLIFLQCTVKTRPVTVDRVRYISHRFADDNGIFIPHFYNMPKANLQVMKKNPVRYTVFILIRYI